MPRPHRPGEPLDVSASIIMVATFTLSGAEFRITTDGRVWIREDLRVNADDEAPRATDSAEPPDGVGGEWVGPDLSCFCRDDESVCVHQLLAAHLTGRPLRLDPDVEADDLAWLRSIPRPTRTIDPAALPQAIPGDAARALLTGPTMATERLTLALRDLLPLPALGTLGAGPAGGRMGAGSERPEFHALNHALARTPGPLRDWAWATWLANLGLATPNFVPALMSGDSTMLHRLVTTSTEGELNERLARPTRSLVALLDREMAVHPPLARHLATALSATVRARLLATLPSRAGRLALLRALAAPPLSPAPSPETALAPNAPASPPAPPPAPPPPTTPRR